MLVDTQQRGIIEESDSPWSSPVVLMWKNEGLCFCIDYMKLNITKKGFPTALD
jgi:hypothetical protein